MSCICPAHIKNSKREIRGRGKNGTRGGCPTESKICVPCEGNQPTTTGAEAREEVNASWNPQEADRTGAHVGDNPWDSAGAGWGGHGDL